MCKEQLWDRTVSVGQNRSECSLMSNCPLLWFLNRVEGGCLCCKANIWLCYKMNWKRMSNKYTSIEIWINRIRSKAYKACSYPSKHDVGALNCFGENIQKPQCHFVVSLPAAFDLLLHQVRSASGLAENLLKKTLQNQNHNCSAV